MSRDKTEVSNKEVELAYLYENAPLGLCVTDLQHRYIRINQFLCDINGMTIEEHVGHTVQEVIPHVAEQIVPMFQRVIDSGESVMNFEVRGTTTAHPNEERIFLGNHYPLRSKSGEVCYVHTMVQDVTEQRRAELVLKESNEELSARVAERTAELVTLSTQLNAEVIERRRAEEAARAGEERLRRLIESTQIIPWEADATTWKFTYVGPQATSLGYPIESWYEQDFWVDHIHSDDREAAVQFCASQLPHGKSYEFEYRMIAADGKEVWLHDLVSIELSDGKPVRLRGFMVDITHQKRASIDLARSEETFRRLLQAAPDGVAIVDRHGVILLANRQMAHMFGCADKDLKGCPIDQFVPGDARDKHREYRDTYARDPVPRTMGAMSDLHGQRQDGSLFPVDVCLSPLTFEGEAVTACFVRDQTDRKRIEKAMREHRDTLARFERTASMEQLAGAISHELNQPLTGILSNAQAGELILRKGDYARDEFAEIIAEIVADTKRAGEVIRNLRDLYREHTADFAAVDVNAIVRDTIRILHSEFILQHVTLDEKLAKTLPEVKGNRIQIQQVLLNLIMNGHEAMAGIDEAGRRLRIATELKANEVIVSVADSGPGIDADRIERIFQPLATWKPGGTGMGLAISNSIVRAHGGRMWAENRPEGGARMSFSIPLPKETS